MKSYSLILITLIAFCTTHAVDYVDLESYRNSAYQQPQPGFLEKLFKPDWNSFKSSINESIFADNITSEQFWNTLRSSLEDGSFYNRVSQYKTSDKQSGGDIFLRTVYSSINQIPVKYKSVLPNGDSLLLSGKIFLPKNENAKHIIIANHYTICSNNEAPSNASCIEGIFAAKDYIVLMPDYIGYGISDTLTHPYLHLESTVNSALDLLRAVIPYLKANSYSYYPSIILIGYSQGAAATLALQKKIEEQFSHIHSIHKVYVGAGPYDLKGTFDYYISQHTTDIPCSLPMLISGINYGERLNLKQEDFFQPTLLEKYPTLIGSKAKSMNEVNAELGNNIDLLLKPIIYHPDSFPTSILYDAVQKNSIVHWTPKAKLFLFHSTEDNMVPFLNSEHLQKEFEKQHLDNVQYDFAPYGNHMRAAVYFFEKVYKSL